MSTWTAQQAGKGFTLDVDFDPNRLTAKDVMQYGVIDIGPKEPVAKAMSLLMERNISGLPVVEDGRLAGILSDKDILQLACAERYLPGHVEDYMTATAYTFDVDDRISDICRYLAERPFRRVPILHEERLAGMITRRDLVNVYKEAFRPPDGVPASRAAVGLVAEQLMQGGLLTVQTETTVYEAMCLLADHHLTGLPVVDEGMQLAGIVTETDLLRHAVTGHSAETVVEPFMTRAVVSVDRGASIEEVCQHLIENVFHHLPVLDGNRLVGVITRSDVLRRRMPLFRLRGSSRHLPRPSE